MVRWLERLIEEGLIPQGHVDNRPIQDIEPGDLEGYAQHHFFAGLGGWAEALRLAGVPQLECWTGSCPCVDFSPAGKRRGLDGEQHVWPFWFALIRECKPRTIFDGEPELKEIVGLQLDPDGYNAFSNQELAQLTGTTVKDIENRKKRIKLVLTKLAAPSHREEGDHV